MPAVTGEQALDLLDRVLCPEQPDLEALVTASPATAL
jgi:hypothetical protein